MRIPDYVTRFYAGKELPIETLTGRVRYGKTEKFAPSLRILYYVKKGFERSGMAFLPLIWNLMEDDKGEVTIPLYLVNKEETKLSSYLGRMLRRGELIKKRERLVGTERKYYEENYLLHRLLRIRKSLNTTTKIDREFKVRNLTEQELFETTTPAFWVVSSLYTSPLSVEEVSEKTGYANTTIATVNYILHVYGFTKRKKERGCLKTSFKNPEIAFKFLTRFDKFKESIVSRIRTYIEVKESQLSAKKLAEKYNIPERTILSWRHGAKPYHLTEAAAKTLGFSERLIEICKKYGIIEEVDEFEEEFLIEE